MWLCTKLGFFSVVQKSFDEVHIRARCEQDLKNLKFCSIAFVPGASKWKIHRSEPADYRWRIVIKPDALIKVMAMLAEHVDYSNFKGVIASLPDQRGKMDEYFQFHHDMERWQTEQDAADTYPEPEEFVGTPKRRRR